MFQQVDVGDDLVCTLLETCDGAGELLRDGAFLEGGGFEAIAELGATDRPVGGEVDESLLLLFKGAELLAQRFLLLFVSTLERLECTAHLLSECAEVALIESLGGDRASDGSFHDHPRGWWCRGCDVEFPEDLVQFGERGYGLEPGKPSPTP